LIACTPSGCIALLQHYNIDVSGKNVVVIGRSRLVGKPVACLLLSLNATVTQCHSKTTNIPHLVSQADIVVAAIGKANFVQGSWLKQGAVVIDVGMNHVKDDTKKSGLRLCGDVDYASCLDKVKMITPVPGGVGPMTVTMLMKNTIKAFVQQRSSMMKS
jgi:methylenetetrahydrofolate dehydrogenase (NADP+)/methenyltetrahydrofolate cyclohydrolase/formyltetrahydrofolate synthetase